MPELPRQSALDMAAKLPSGRHGIPPARVRAHQLERLLAATTELSEEVGYEAMTVSAIIARAGVSRYTFYEFFDDREDAFVASFERLLREPGEDPPAVVAVLHAAAIAGVTHGGRLPVLRDRPRASAAALLQALEDCGWTLTRREVAAA